MWSRLVEVGVGLAGLVRHGECNDASGDCCTSVHKASQCLSLIPWPSHPFHLQTGFAWGWMEPAHPQAEEPSSNGSSSTATAAAAAVATAGDGGPAAASAAPATAWLPSWRMRWGGQQAGLLRFNCADSLDRTNAATCFAMLPVLQEQLRVLGIPLESAVPPATAALMRSRQRSSTGDVAALASQQPGALEAQEAAAAAALPEVSKQWSCRGSISGSC